MMSDASAERVTCLMNTLINLMNRWTLVAPLLCCAVPSVPVWAISALGGVVVRRLGCFAWLMIWITGAGPSYN